MLVIAFLFRLLCLAWEEAETGPRAKRPAELLRMKGLRQ